MDKLYTVSSEKAASRMGENNSKWSNWQRINLKNDRMISVRFQGKPFNITVIQVYAPTSNAEEAEVKQFYEDLQCKLNFT